MSVDDIVVNLIALHGGRLVGRTRLQRQAYLLHRRGAGFDLPFVYHHYGPYSFDLVDGLTGACADGRIDVEEKFGRHGVPYAIFTLGGDTAPPEGIGQLAAADARELLETMKNVSDVVLELAAAIVFLREEGGYADQAEEETRVRKPLKATDACMTKARALLDTLGLQEEMASA